MSTMKSFITTLDLVMQDKVEPETVVEEDEIEETLTINEDGEIVDENWITDKIQSGVKKWKEVKREKEKDPRHWSGGQARKDESIEQEIEEYVLECERLHEMKRLSGQVITEAPMTAEHYTAVADIIASIEDPNVRKRIMVKFTDNLESKYANFQRERFVNHIVKAAQAQQAEDPAQLPAQLPAGQSETETEVMVQTPEGTKVVKKGSEEHVKAEAGEEGYGLAESAEKKIDEDWGSSDWHVAMEEMGDSLLKRHNGKVTPETMEQAAEEVIMMHGEQMGYDEDSHDDGVSQVISMFLNRQDGIKNSDMVGLANDTWKHSEKTKYM